MQQLPYMPAKPVVEVRHRWERAPETVGHRTSSNVPPNSRSVGGRNSIARSVFPLADSVKHTRMEL